MQIESLATLYAKGGDPELKAELALLMGGMRPDARVTGQRLLNYHPPTPGVTQAPPTPKEAPPAKEPPARTGAGEGTADGQVTQNKPKA